MNGLGLTQCVWGGGEKLGLGEFSATLAGALHGRRLLLQPTS